MDFQKIIQEITPATTLADHHFSIQYSHKFNHYNANVRYFRAAKHIEFHLSKHWKTVSEEIVIGLLQSLLIKLLRKNTLITNTTTVNIELYNLFMKNLHIAAQRIASDTELIELFNQLNDLYFHGCMDMPNLVWGNDNFRKLGSYEYATDTVTISTALRNAQKEFISYVLYHELLHKKHKFNSKNGRSFHHTATFKKDEALFHNYQQVENNIKKYLSSRKSRFSLFHW